MNPTTEALLTQVMNVLAEKFKNQLVLKGGMQLRLLNSPRSTQDIDFILISKTSKKILIQSVREALAQIDELSILKENLNSRGIFITIEEKTKHTKALIEISVLPSTYLPPEPLSTFPLSSRYALGARIISTMALPEAFSHKIAASLEREVMRDLYDISILEPMGSFDIKTLSERLSRICIKRQKPQSLSFHQAAEILRKRLERMTEISLKEELYPLLPLENQVGLLRVIQASAGRVIQKLEAL